jgi:nudix-type nucleoside diphosphatase (YffH/AdpP family)
LTGPVRRHDGVARIISEELVYGGWNRLTRVALAMPDGAVVERHIEDHGTSVTVLPYDPERRTALLVSMPRAAVIRAGEDDLLEAIAGRLDGDDPAHCAAQEALEEAGVRLAALEPVGCFWSMPTLSLERIRFYLAPYGQGDRVSAGGGSPEEAENIAVHELPLAELAAMAGDGRLRDLKTMVLLQALMLRRPQLFAAAAAPAGERG